ncbi:hypothetical protein C2S53_014657 [Perilla frutescens var. hirtella]|uniref:DDE Tnp4 domain-containing protein n=1 Tax=Perilla frutescens var. hirtella TaxID=608512 RepID=A0AAD4P1T6_PERFH|nr:hypothetical protein C2S53_014657 [Perilla frutescens var. hirtella]
MLKLLIFVTRVITTDYCRKYKLKAPYSVNEYDRSRYIHRLIYTSDKTCHDELRMDRYTFRRLVIMLETIEKLKATRNLAVDEQVAIFLYILAHHQKNRTMKTNFLRSGETISRYFNKVLNAVLRLQGHLLKALSPVREDSTDEKWKWFKNCIGALDGTYIEVKVPEVDKPRYRNKKGHTATNVLGVCSQEMQFIYVLAGWEGSAADGRVLRDALSRRNGLPIQDGYYYLVDAGYTNGKGFLAPFRGQRYHLSEWRTGRQPLTPEEFFNMKHASARNVIERCFGMLKMRWDIIRNPNFYPIKQQGRIIMACCLLQNHIRENMPVDPIEIRYGDNPQHEGPIELDGDLITSVEPTQEWTDLRYNLANQMFNHWMQNRHAI